MSEIAKHVTSAGPLKTSEQHQRAHAVAAALEVIAARASGASGNMNLDYEFEKLSTYADQIQAALKAD
ncbi:hypothetical protein WCE04_23885 [Pseudomonas shirazica]|uniref:hypothetical protein n=1 Tax=Pseudomonas shirazica TaxID=1940636 RepID=UPI0034D671CF